MNLDILRADFIESGEDIPLSPHESSGSDNIYLSDLGRCPRQVMLRVTRAKQRPLTPSEVRMFWVGNQLHELTQKALLWAGLMMEYERPCDCPEGLSGRFDSLWLDDGVLTLTDHKTVRSNQFKYGEFLYDPPQPKPYHLPQIGGYILWGPEAESYDFDYMDRDGSHKSIRAKVDTRTAAGRAEEEAGKLLRLWNVKEIPGPLPVEFKPHFNRSKTVLTWIGMKRPWKCDSIYCRFSGVSCTPNGEDEVRVWDNDKGYVNGGSKYAADIDRTLEAA